jgi:hypothetical protein
VVCVAGERRADASVAPMGQLVDVVEKRSTTPYVVRFETNRTLSGMGHERFASVEDAYGDTPSDELARRLFATGRIDGVHIYSNIITVDLAKGANTDGLADIVRNLYTYWKPGIEPPSFEDLQPAEPESGAGDDAGGAATGDAGDAALSEAAKRVPAHLLERSRQARERWNAKQG